MSKSVETNGPPGLDPLVQVLCEVEDRRGMTPVLVSDPHLLLADEFYVQLCLAVTQRSGRSVRLDLLPGHRLSCSGAVTPLLGGWAAAPWLPPSAASAIFSPMRKTFIKRLAKRLPERSRIESTAAVARPGGALRELVIGLAGPEDELPPFAQEISLGVEHDCGPP